MTEVRLPSRLSTRVLRHAIGFRARILQCPDDIAARVAQTAALHPLTWTRALSNIMAEAGVCEFAGWRQGRCTAVLPDPIPKSIKKQEISAYMKEVVAPALLAREQGWANKQRHTVQDHGIVLADVLPFWPLHVVRAWAQFRLQGTLTLPGGIDMDSYDLCDSPSPPQLAHLLTVCPAAAATIMGVVAGTAWESLSPAERLCRFSKSPSVDDARVAASLAAALRKRILRHDSVAAPGADDSDTSEEDDLL